MINRKHISFFCLWMLLVQLSTAQVQTNPPMRQVIGTTGGTGVLPWGSIDFTVGEVMTWTYTSGAGLNIKDLTQGFNQPDGGANSNLDANVIFANASCIGANNGSASLNILSFTGPVLTYWLAPLNDSSLNVANLAPGTYYFHIEDGNFSIDDSVVIGETQVDCADSLNFYTGITPNGDGNNDIWVIEGMQYIKDNHVTVFNRWGDVVWQAKDYDNITDNKVWKGTNSNGGELPDATYFYIIEANGKVYKGWVELTH